MIRSYVIAWFVMLIVAFANAAIREILFARWFAADRARQVSTLTLLAALGIVIYAVATRWPFRSGSHALVVGVTWAVAIVAFEFILGALTGQSWRQMLAAYDVRTGTLWPAVPLFVAIAPAIFHRLQQDLS